MSNANIVPKLYRNVIEEVIKNVKEAFLNEGVDEQVLQELKQIWENKLLQSRAVDGIPTDNQQPARQQYMYPHIVQTTSGIPASTLTRQPQQPQQQQQRVAISHASTTPIPGTIAHRPAPTGHTTIIFPEARTGQAQSHIHALSQMTPAATAATLALPGMQVQRPTEDVVNEHPCTHCVIKLMHKRKYKELLTSIKVGQEFPLHILQQGQYKSLKRTTNNYKSNNNNNNSSSNNSSSSNGHNSNNNKVNSNNMRQHKFKPTNLYMYYTDFTNVFETVPQMIIQVDGVNDSDSDDGDDDLGDGDEDEDHDRNAGPEFEEEPPPEEDEPLNSEDDDSDDGATDLFDTENVVVCQFEKIARSRNRWKFHLKDGIMNVKGKDYIFHRATGEAEW
ncbi:hypothetical protein QZH41_012321 [Actinostola sp. cb2023]|nr:hypothetical protein QZH41_012321 [Actinostola sp. cb2023]